NGGGMVSLAAGLHTLPATLRLPSGVTIAGTGIDCEVFLDPASTQYEASIVNAEADMHDVVLRDFVIEGAATPQASKDPNGDVQRRRTQHGPIPRAFYFSQKTRPYSAIFASSTSPCGTAFSLAFTFTESKNLMSSIAISRGMAVRRRQVS